ncbi:MAG TPA: PAAR domain-containing protein [Candidatus Polarisedimenticolia bacterium]|jgi:uncharacterized Zn-binding protein involved in type VI secretion|nr:PAAR domain-containing protein [Candidatus Polarisedimenticolia bacterium]
MGAMSRMGDGIEGGVHCHGHLHGPRPTPGAIVEGSTKVFVEGLPAARTGDHGLSPQCCGGVGEITILQLQTKVFIDGKPAAGVGTPTMHCGMAPGTVKGGASRVFIAS